MEQFILVAIYFIVHQDYNGEGENNEIMEDFCYSYSLGKLIQNESACFKNSGKPSRKDLILTKLPHSFPGSYSIENGMSEFHHSNKKKSSVYCSKLVSFFCMYPF